MSNYAESKKKIEAIRNKDEISFRMAISHLMDVGIRHLTEELVEEACEKIMQEDDSKAFMTNGFRCNLVRTAYELAQIDHIDLLVYIQREVDYDVFDGAISYKRAIQLLKKCMSWIEDNHCGCAETLDTFYYLDFTDDEIESFGYQYLFDCVDVYDVEEDE